MQKAASYLERAQNGDGGFGYVPSAASDVDDTGAAVQALAAAGRSSATGAVKRAVAYLRDVQNRDGGFGQMASRDSNAQSTAWAVQGLVAAWGCARRPSARIRSVPGLTPAPRRPHRLLRAPTARGSDQTPVWVTARL